MRMKSKSSVSSETDSGGIPALPLTSCVTLNRSLHFSGLQFHHPKGGGNKNNSCAQNWVFPPSVVSF